MTSDAAEKPDSSANRWWHVNRKLLPMKAHFFLFFGSFAGTGPACILYCTKVGMSMSEIGTLYGVLPLLQFLSKIVFGSIADKFQMHKAAFLTSIFSMGVFLFSINYLPIPSDGAQNVTWTPADGATIECFRSSAELMQLTMCDRNASNKYFTVLSSATVTCDVSCDTSGLGDFATLFCDEDDRNCLSNHRNSFYETLSSNARQSIAVFTVVSSSKHKPEASNSSCVTLPIVSVSFTANVNATTNVVSFEEHPANGTAAAKSSGCRLRDAEPEVNITCEAVCMASVKPSKYAPMAAKRDTTMQYVWIWVAFLVSWCAYGTLMSTSDTILLHLLEGRYQDFGKTRLFGSLGWGLMGPIVGYIIDKVSEDLPEKNYSPGFYLFGAFMLADFLVNIPTKVCIPEKSKKLAKDIFEVVRQPAIVLTGFAVFVNGTTTGFLWTFLVVYMNELSGGMQLIIGLNYAVECFLSEIPFFLVSGWVVSKLGHSHSMSISLFVCGLKTFLISFIHNAWYILIVSLLHGVTYGLLYASMATYIGEIAPPGTAATFQGIFQGIYEGIGVAVGNFLGGHAYQHLGGRKCFWLFGLMTIAASVVHFIAVLIVQRITRHKSSDAKFNLPSFASGTLQ